jgi:hypothetical protein
LLLHPFRARRTAQVDAVMVSAVER